MPSPYEIIVAYDPTAIPLWSITCVTTIPPNPTFPVTVMMRQAPNSNFNFVRVLDLNNPQWTGTNTPTDGGKTMTLVEHNEQQGENPFRVVINYRGTQVTSPEMLCGTGLAATKTPPMIINDGSVPGGKKK
jgi:hypothetical protein